MILMFCESRLSERVEQSRVLYLLLGLLRKCGEYSTYRSISQELKGAEALSG
jgi:hypothetical protein